MNNETLLSIAIVATPTLFVLGALFNLSSPRWRLAQVFAGLALAASLFSLSMWLGSSAQHQDIHPLQWVTQTNSSLIMLTLVSFIGLVNLIYSSRYMAGKASREAYYVRWLSLTLAAVTLVASTNHMLVFLIAWIAISVSLHQLLMFFPDRPRAALAAHKKFIFARVAETSLFAAIMLLYGTHQTWNISEITQLYFDGEHELGLAEQIAAVLIAFTALIKCAQLPWHGWLIQVVEAPTPVSALLHAGIINLGGFLVIQFGPLIMQSSASQWLLLVIGGLTTVLAALVMMTRASVKVKLAWSTMSQMGLMLVECALGLFELALLHLIAHSCYKAYAFLNSGSEVEGYLRQQLAPASRPGLLQWLLAAGISAALVTGVVILLGFSAPYSPWLLLGVAMTLLIAERSSQQTGQNILFASVFAALLVIVYTLQKQGLGLAISHMHASVGVAADIWMALLFVLFSITYLVLRYGSQRPVTQKLTVALYAGFYLDEWATRTTLKIWPAKLPVRNKPKFFGLGQEEIIK